VVAEASKTQTTSARNTLVLMRWSMVTLPVDFGVPPLAPARSGPGLVRR